jgi:hypothetical protein
MINQHTCEPERIPPKFSNTEAMLAVYYAEGNTPQVMTLGMESMPI